MTPEENLKQLIGDKHFQMRDFTPTNFSTEQDEQGTPLMIIEGVPCVFNRTTTLFETDAYEYQEIILPDAFANANMNDVIFNYNHHGRVYARTRNKSLTVFTRDDGLHMRAQLLQNDEGHSQLFRDIQSGLIDRMSFAFTVMQSKVEYIERTGQKTICLCTIEQIDRLYDVSAVDLPAYDTTTISARSWIDAECVKKSKDIAERLAVEKAKYFYFNNKKGE